jgi:hypothetical protein
MSSTTSENAIDFIRSQESIIVAQKIQLSVNERNISLFQKTIKELQTEVLYYKNRMACLEKDMLEMADKDYTHLNKIRYIYIKI